MHCIQGSDAHRLDRDPNRESNLGIGDRVTEIQLPQASFAALKELFRSNHFDRTRPARAGGPAADELHAAREAGPQPVSRSTSGSVSPAPVRNTFCAMSRRWRTAAAA